MRLTDLVGLATHPATCGLSPRLRAALGVAAEQIKLDGAHKTGIAVHHSRILDLLIGESILRVKHMRWSLLSADTTRVPRKLECLDALLNTTMDNEYDQVFLTDLMAGEARLTTRILKRLKRVDAAKFESAKANVFRDCQAMSGVARYLDYISLSLVEWVDTLKGL